MQPISKNYYVYTHAKPNTADLNGIFYVGMGTIDRVRKVNRPHNKYHIKIVNKYGSSNIIVRKMRCYSREHALKTEMLIISALKKIGIRIVNVTDGGDGSVGYTHTEESKLKISIAGKNRKVRPETIEKLRIAGSKRIITEESRKKMSISHIGKKPTEETRKKLSLSLTGRTFSDETKLKMSASSLGKKKSKSHIENMSKANTGKKLSNETRLKMSESQKNMTNETKMKISETMRIKKSTPEWKAKMSEIAKKRWEKKKD